MSRGWLRLTLVLAVMTAMGAAGFRLFRLEAARGADAARQEAVDEQARRLHVHVADLAAAQRSYVAPGQGYHYWAAQVATMLTELDDELARMVALVDTDGAREALDTARAVAGDIRKLDLQVREHIDTGQRVLASDLIFTDAVQLTGNAAQQIESARLASVSAAGERIARARREERWWLAGVAGLALIALIGLMPQPRARVAADSGDSSPAWDSGAGDLSLNPMAGGSIQPMPQRPDVEAAARLCTDLARLTDAADLPELLARAAAALGARGLVLWLSDGDRKELRAALMHGYPAHALAHLGPIACDAENATAAAFRDGRLTSVPGDGVSNGAIVAPLIAPIGCLGTLAVEVPSGLEQDPQARAIAAILAAQLSVLVAAVPPAEDIAQAQA